MFYKNHPPTYVYAYWGLVKLLGDYEWVYRSFTLIFSVLNIFLIFQIAKLVWKDETKASWAAFFQAFFLGTVYFGRRVL